MTPTDDILAKIQKLLALAAHNDNPAEAELATSRVQELLQTYNLSMAQVAATTAKAKPDATFTDVKRTKGVGSTKAAMYKYQRTLMESLAKNNFCRYWLGEEFNPDPRGSEYSQGVRGRMVKRHMLLGAEVNVTVTRLTYDYLVDTMDRMLPYTGMQKRGKEALIWLDGCAKRLTERLDDQRYERQRHESKNASPSQAGLVRLVDVYATEDELNADFANGDEPGTRTRERLKREAVHRADKEREDVLVANGMDRNEAWYVARGYSVPPKVRVEGKTETDAQRRKREAKEEAERERSRAKWGRIYEKEAQRQSHHAYRDGRRAANDIGLESQVATATEKRKIG